MGKSKKYKSKINKDRKLLHFQRELIESNLSILKQKISSFKKTIPINEIKKYFSTLYKTTNLKQYFETSLYPSKLSDFKSNTILRKSTLQRELLWTVLLINENRAKIDEYLLFKKEFESCMLKSDYLKALKTIQIAKEYLGYSHWIIQNELILKQNIEGLDAQKEYAKELKEESGEQSFAAFFVHYLSIRCEENISNGNFKSILEDAMYSLNLNEDFKEYLRFKLLTLDSINNIRSDNLPYILCLEHNSPIIDIYETFIQVYTTIITRFFDEAIDDDDLKMPLLTLKTDISDTRLNALVMIFGRNSIPFCEIHKDSIIKAFDYYTSGEYLKCINHCYYLFDNMIYDISIIDIFVHSHIYNNICPITSKEVLIDKIIKNLYHLILKDEYTLISIENLLNIMKTYQGHKWINGLYAFIVNQISEDKILQRSTIYRLKLLTSDIPSPFRASLFNENIQKSYLNKLKEYFPNSSMQLLYNEIQKLPLIKSLSNIPKYRSDKYEAINLYLNDKIPESERKFKDLISMNNELISNDAKSAYVNILVNNGQLKDACEIMVKYILENSFLYFNLPLKRLVDQLDEPKKWPNIISIPIVFSLNSRFYDNSKDNYLKFAYEKFLISCNIEKPTELKDKFKEFCDSNLKIELIYYLRYICIPEVMKHSVYFDSSLELEDERINICKILKEFDDQNKKIYDDEINDRTKKIVIQEGVNRVGKSKVYVDIPKVKAYYEKNLLNENFKRYQTFQDDFEDTNESILRETLNAINEIKKRKNIDDSSDDALYEMHLLNIPSNERADLFGKILKQIVDGFINREFGLNVYISTRIRHGNLSNELRSPVEAQSLVTTKIDQTDTYNFNTYWDDKIQNIPDKEKAKLLDELSRFSRKYDDFTDYIIDKILVVTTQYSEKESKALFKYFITNLELIDLQDKIDKTTTYDDFIDIALTWMWKKTDYNLKNIQTLFETEIKDTFLGYLDELTNNINENFDEPPMDLFDAIAKARTDLQIVIDNVTSWFTRSDLNVYTNYNLDIAIETAKKIITRSNSSIQTPLCLELNIDDSLEMGGSTFEHFVDIFLILLNNAFKHSGLESNFPEIKVNISKNENDIDITFLNPIFKDKTLDELNEELIHLKASSASEEVEKVLIKRGGTGIYRIGTILDKNLSCNHTIDFAYKETDSFVQKTVFEIKLKLLNQELTSEYFAN